MRFNILPAAVLVLTLLPVNAQQSLHQGHPAPAPGVQSSSGGGAREFVKFPAMMVEHTLANMRDHLAALQEMNEHLGMGHPEVAAKISEERLGMSSLGLHGAQHSAQFMPKGMQDIGSEMHRAASRFAVVARDAGVTGDMKPVFAAIGAITAQCVGCHAAYRIK